MPKHHAHPLVDPKQSRRGIFSIHQRCPIAWALCTLLMIAVAPVLANQAETPNPPPPPAPPAQTKPTHQPDPTPKPASKPQNTPGADTQPKPKEESQTAKPHPTDPSSILTALLSEQTPAAQRIEIADDLLSQTASDTEVGSALAEMLLKPDSADAAAIVLDRIAQRMDAPAVLEAPIIALSKDVKSNNGLRYKALAALGTYRTRQAAAALVVALSDPDDTIRTQAYASLERLTGHDGFAREPRVWQQWLSNVLEKSEQAWSEELLRARMTQVDRLRSRLARDDQVLVEAWRKVHLLTPIDERSDLLAELLQSDLPVLQNLGFELLNREISESRTLKPIVAQAAIGLLKHTDPHVRARAAILLHRLAPASAQEPVYAALNTESDPEAAQALLLAATRWPSMLGRGPILRWLAGPVDVRLRAAGLAWELLRSKQLVDQADRAQVLKGVRSIPDSQLTTPACRILATLGQQEDLARLQTLLKAEEPAVRTMAADALALRKDQVDILLAHATNDPTLYESTARAVQTHLHDASGYAELAALPAPSPQVRDRVLSRFAALLPTKELVRLAKLAGDPAEAIHLLVPLTAKERLADPAQTAARTEGLIMLAQMQLEMGNPSDGLNALSLLPNAQPASGTPSTSTQGTTPPPDPDPDATTETQKTHDLSAKERKRINDLRVIFLIWLNRLDQAQAIDASPDAWLTGLEHIRKESYAQPIANAFKARFDKRLTKPEQERFAAIQASLNASAEQTTPETSVPKPKPTPVKPTPEKGGVQTPPPPSPSPPPSKSDDGS